MSDQSPRATLDARYSEETAEATPWPDAVALLEQAGLFWVSTVRTDGRPHVTPVVAVWMDGALYFTSGPGEQKSRNLVVDQHCAVTTGCNTWDEGFDIVLHGEAVITRDLPLLQRVADAFLAKYGSDWAFEVAADGTFRGPLVYQLAPAQALGFGKDPFSHPLGLHHMIRACRADGIGCGGGFKFARPARAVRRPFPAAAPRLVRPA